VIQKTLALFAVVLTTLCAAPVRQAEAAAPNWDIDYQLYVGVQAWKYEVWVDPPNGPAYKDSTHNSQYDASWRLFKMYEWNQVPSGADVWIETVSYTNWVYWLTFETYSQATDAADDWEALGFPTKITPIFGGYLYPITISPYSSAANIGYFTDVALALDAESDNDSDGNSYRSMR